MKPLKRKSLKPHQLAFKLDSGETMVVSVTRQREVRDGFAFLDVDATVNDAAGMAHVVPRFTHSIQLATLTAPGSAEEHLAHAYNAVEQRALAFLTAQRVFLDLPETPDPAEGETETDREAVRRGVHRDGAATTRGSA